MNAVVVCVAAVISTMALARRRVRSSTAWTATVTPLASIIGSGFLVLAPLLAATAGEWAPVAMIVIVGLAYAIGATIRFNIAHGEALLESDRPPLLLVEVERVAQFLLGIAYMISVGFYLRLLASFLLDAVGVDSALGGRLVTTAALVGIGLVGWFRGLHGIEAFEVPAVDVKLVVIAGLLAGMLAHAAAHAGAAVDAFGSHPVPVDGVTLVRRLAGMLLVVQGFETSRYLGRYYERELRIRTMRRAQIISGIVYVVFAILAVPLFDHLGGGAHETAVVHAARFVTPLLGPLIVIAAVASQLSAAAADTAGGSEMITNRPRHQHGNIGYLVVAAGALVVVWGTDVFGIVSVASRAFAGYYLCQCVGAAIVAARVRPHRYRTIVAANLVLAVVLAGIAVGAVPGE